MTKRNSEDKTFKLHVTQPLQIAFVGGWPRGYNVFLLVLVVKYPVQREIHAPREMKIEPGFALSTIKA